MTDFRNELIESLLSQSGQLVDITNLISKYCGDNNSFEPKDETLIKYRLNINRVLTELKEMGWLNVQPSYGLTTAHKLNHETGRRQYTLEEPVKVRLTTKGEFEYKKLKQDTASNIQNIGVNNGIATQQSGVSQQIHISQLAAEAKKDSFWIRVWKWILRNAGLILIGLILSYLTYKFGWNQ
jgi:hypothetical protein